MGELNECVVSIRGNRIGRALGKIFGRNDGMKNPGKMDGSKAGSWLWKPWVLPSFLDRSWGPDKARELG